MEHTNKQTFKAKVMKMKNWKNCLVCIYCIIVTLTLSIYIVLLIFTYLITDTEIDHLSNWREFYINKVSHYFYIPQEAKIVFAKEYYRFPMGYKIIVKFHLPPTKSPEEWIKVIAQKSGFISKHRIDKLLYKEQKGDICREIRYLPKRDLYVVIYSW